MVETGLIPCDICGSVKPGVILEPARLDGPLVECRSCGLRYVGRRRSKLAFGSETPGVVADRVRRANADFQHLSLEEEHRLALLNARWRADLIRGFRNSGKLLEVGCARGDFLRVARESFDAYGVEPNPELADFAALVAPVHRDLVETAPWCDFDVVASFHVIEHVDSPRRFIAAIRERLKPGGLAVIETPNIRSMPFRIFGKHWRQFIPEHYFFFDPATITRLFQEEGLKVERTIRIGKYASVELIMNRFSRYLPLLSSMPRLPGLSRLTFRVDPMDIMLVFATRSGDDN
jgi:2-polyprenyl-3-methyl-5-hydroxy-6-metoxy-1,4-benzoquinol methylase